MNDSLKTSQAGLEFITQWEGLILKPYKDVAGLRTIGVGHLIKPNENFPDGVSITKEKALELLAIDVQLCENAIKKSFQVVLNQNQFDALVSFGFNCGVGVYTNSGVAKAISSNDFNKVPARLQEWCKARVNGTLTTVPGLLNRRKAESDLFMKPVANFVITDYPIQWTKEMLIDAQSRLKKLGLYKLNVDGFWGPGTNSAVVEFAKRNNLTLADPSKGVSNTFLNELKNQT